jgi:hypothetical protein
MADHLQKRVYDLAKKGKLLKLREVLEEEHPPDVDGHEDGKGRNALGWTCRKGHTECARLLIEHHADVNARDNEGYGALYGAAGGGHLSCVQLLVQSGADVDCQSNGGWTPLMRSTRNNYLHIAQYLLGQKADIHLRAPETCAGASKNIDALFCAMKKYETDRTLGIAFAVLCRGTDAKNIPLKHNITAQIRDAHSETYQHVQAFIDEYHDILKLALSEVPVDTRVGSSLSHVSLVVKRTLEYLGLSMSKDQVVNTSIDGEEEGIKRALIPGHLLSANHWFNRYITSQRQPLVQQVHHLSAPVVSPTGTP